MNLGYFVGQIKDDSDIAGTAAVLAVVINAVIPVGYTSVCRYLRVRPVTIY